MAGRTHKPAVHCAVLSSTQKSKDDMGAAI
jgi:hypothetical protein